jgi:hypothetical protein
MKKKQSSGRFHLGFIAPFLHRLRYVTPSFYRSRPCQSTRRSTKNAPAVLPLQFCHYPAHTALVIWVISSPPPPPAPWPMIPIAPSIPAAEPPPTPAPPSSPSSEKPVHVVPFVRHLDRTPLQERVVQFQGPVHRGLLQKLHVRETFRSPCVLVAENRDPVDCPAVLEVSL